VRRGVSCARWGDNGAVSDDQGYPPYEQQPAAQPPYVQPPPPPPYPPPPPQPYPPQPYPPQPYPPQPYPLQEDTTWSVVAHLCVPISAVIGLSFVLGPLIIMLTAGPQRPFTRANAVEALNFQLTMLIGLLLSIPLVLVIVGIFTMIAIVVAGLVFSIIAAVAASRREVYRYPVTLRMVS
jgi:uncharacterized protein